MRFLAFKDSAGEGLAVCTGEGEYRGLPADALQFPGRLEELLAQGGDSLDAAAAILSQGQIIDRSAVEILPPLRRPGKIVCVGLNYFEHVQETTQQVAEYPVLFGRFPSSLIGDGQPLLVPRVSSAFDFEAELVAIIGRSARHISEADALSHVAGYALFNDASVRDYQLKSQQWTIGKNFDDTGAFGPDFVTADELPPGAAGLAIRCTLNGEVVQEANTSQMIFNVAKLISILSEAMTLEPGDMIVTGTPGGIGAARKPPLWMKPGDVCEVFVESVGTLRNPIAAEPR
jgi:2-keto-4-pentenoate hydratase/2-oxohepta-3-ene-1,7-dioic acid hydratase in catechol pathway